MRDEIEWESFGQFSIARGKNTLLAKLPFFDESFREYARNQRARWDGLARAWVFPSTKEQDVLFALNEMNLARKIQLDAQEEANAKIQAELKSAPFEFSSAKFNVRQSDELSKFIVKTPYDEKTIRTLRDAGGRWNRELKAHVVPFSALELLREMTRTPREEREKFEQRNRPMLVEEGLNPLATKLIANPGGHELKVELDVLALTYKVTFPFAIDSSLGIEVFREILAKHKAFDVVRPEDIERQYPRVNLNSIIFEIYQRSIVVRCLEEIQERLRSLGPYEKLEISEESLRGRRWARSGDPIAGEVIFEQHRAWLIAKSIKTKNKVTLCAHPMSATQAIERLKKAMPTSKSKTCDMSGIDFDAFDSYIEALLLREASETKSIKAPSKTSPRL